MSSHAHKHSAAVAYHVHYFQAGGMVGVTGPPSKRHEESGEGTSGWVGTYRSSWPCSDDPVTISWLILQRDINTLGLCSADWLLEWRWETCSSSHRYSKWQRVYKPPEQDLHSHNYPSKCCDFYPSSPSLSSPWCSHFLFPLMCPPLYCIIFITAITIIIITALTVSCESIKVSENYCG